MVQGNSLKVTFIAFFTPWQDLPMQKNKNKTKKPKRPVPFWSTSKSYFIFNASLSDSHCDPSLSCSCWLSPLPYILWVPVQFILHCKTDFIFELFIDERQFVLSKTSLLLQIFSGTMKASYYSACVHPSLSVIYYAP